MRGQQEKIFFVIKRRKVFSAEFDVPYFSSKKNSKTVSYRRTKAGGIRPFIRTTDKAKLAEQFLVSKLQAGARCPDTVFPLRVPVFGMFVLELANFKTKRKTVNLKAGDLSNLIQAIEDALQKAGILYDDGLIIEMSAEKREGPNRLRIELHEVINELDNLDSA